MGVRWLGRTLLSARPVTCLEGTHTGTYLSERWCFRKEIEGRSLAVDGRNFASLNRRRPISAVASPASPCSSRLMTTAGKGEVGIAFARKKFCQLRNRKWIATLNFGGQGVVDVVDECTFGCCLSGLGAGVGTGKISSVNCRKAQGHQLVSTHTHTHTHTNMGWLQYFEHPFWQRA